MPAADVVGTLGINATPMTILPLVVSKLAVSIAGQDDGPAIGRAGRRAAFAFLVLLTAAAALSAAVMPAAFSWLPIDEATAAALRAGVPAVEAETSPAAAGQWITSLVPSIAFRAAADNAVMPVLVFTAAFALGASRISRELRESIVRFFRAIGAAITVLLHWIVALAPVGVFALGLALAMRLGAGIVTALAYDVVVSSAAMVAITAAPYLVVYAGAGVAPLAFGRAAAPVLAAAGLPVEAMGLLLAVDPIPNAFRTVASVTGILAVATHPHGRPATPCGRRRPAAKIERLFTWRTTQSGESTRMKNALTALAVVVALVLAAAAPASAQTAPAGSTTNMDILVAKLKADKKLLVAQTVGLTDAEGKAFWPVYDACQAELEGVNKRLKAGIEGYAKEYNAGTMTDAKAAAMVTEMLAIDEALLTTKKSCAAKLNGVIPATKIARYLQIENKIRAQINYELAGSIPFVQ